MSQGGAIASTGVGLLGTTLAGAAGGASGSVTTQLINTGTVSAGQTMLAAGAGALGAAAGYGIAKGIGKVFRIITETQSASSTELIPYNKMKLATVDANVTQNVKADFYVKPNGEVVPSTGYRYMDSRYFKMTS
jgi:hypothetical protein